MSILKPLILGLFISIPTIAIAVTTTQLTTTLSTDPTYSGDSRIMPGDIQSTATVIFHSADPNYTSLPFTHQWSLSVGLNELADITFQTFPNSAGFEILNLSAGLGGLNYTDLTGEQTFTITGTPIGLRGGAYVVTTSVSAVPLPTSIWLLSSALVSLVSYRKRKTLVTV
ncbi:MAG: hypothetical protein HOP02_00090 [Methylococcaceae bacterium]|nr:hypothetical protein [Methylococcaceae bacterium]